MPLEFATTIVFCSVREGPDGRPPTGGGGGARLFLIGMTELWPVKRSPPRAHGCLKFTALGTAQFGLVWQGL